MRSTSFLTTVALGLLLVAPRLTPAAGPLLSETTGPVKNKHNLSSRNTGVTFRAQNNPNDPRSTQICIFCHTPHNASPQTALWNRRDPTRTFGRYSSAALVIDNPDVRTQKSFYGEPNGSSRLCLSCHDGLTALGAVLRGGDIQFPTGSERIAYLNISSHHPVSFVYDAQTWSAIIAKKPLEGYQLPLSDPVVKLDKKNRMQCTACHDPHQDQSDIASSLTPFWVGKDHDSVCLACHSIVVPANP
jgi:hypothetical protein